jgi:hypothetical protein
LNLKITKKIIGVTVYALPLFFELVKKIRRLKMNLFTKTLFNGAFIAEVEFPETHEIGSIIISKSGEILEVTGNSDFIINFLLDGLYEVI